jgi:hypothetical protein
MGINETRQATEIPSCGRPAGVIMACKFFSELSHSGRNGGRGHGINRRAVLHTG